MKIYLVFISSIFIDLNAVPLSDELIVLHSATTIEMNAIVSPTAGSLIFNSDDKEVYERNTATWHRISSDGSETKIVAGNCIDITGVGTSYNPYIIKDIIPGKSQNIAGTSCKQILNTGCSSVDIDGTYWINPDGGDTSNAFEVYCDMTTDGGGWTRLEYAADLTHQHHFGGAGDAWRWLPSNFSLTLTDTQINNIRTVSTEGKQHYKGTCQGGVIHYYWDSGNNYADAFAFRFHDLTETARGQQVYAGTDITVSEDGCAANAGALSSTSFDIVDIRVPILNVQSKDSGDGGEQFGSPLTSNHAWLR